MKCIIDRNSHIDICMSFLRTLTTYPDTRQKLRDDGVLDVFIPFIDLLGSSEDLMLRRGFRSGSVVARLAGNDETGVGAQLLKGNPVLIHGTVKILDRVIDAGPKVAVIGMLVNPHFITMDLLIISTSDANKPLLREAIPALIKALKLRGGTNDLMTKDIVKTFLQLTYDPGCKSDLLENADWLCEFLTRVIIAPKYDREALMSSQLLQNSLKPPPPPSGVTQQSDTRRGSKSFKGVVSAVMARKNSLKPVESTEQVGGGKHVMLSYNWNIQPLVKHIDEKLRQQGIKVWLDIRDMGPNLNDSMSEAIEGAAVVFVFMTSAYKESANCRNRSHRQYSLSFVVLHTIQKRMKVILDYRFRPTWDPNGFPDLNT